MNRYYEESRKYFNESPDRQQDFPGAKVGKSGNKHTEGGIHNGNRCTTEPLLIDLKTGNVIPPRDLGGRQVKLVNKRNRTEHGKDCSCCKEPKLWADFYRKQDGQCKACLKAKNLANYYRNLNQKAA
jgi:hypothetical protein